jgi:hypothetical protein
MPTIRMINTIAIAGVLAIAMAWPDALLAQRHGGGGGGRGGGGGGGRAAGPSRGGGGHDGAARDGGGSSGRVASAVPRGGSSRGVYSRPVYYSRAYYGPAYYYGYYGLGYGAPFFGSPFWWGYPGFAWGWGPYGYGYPFGYGYGYGYGWGYPYGWGYDDRGTARTIVKPKETEVFVDGYFVGVADDFDGIFQGMKLDPGGHEITLYLDGYRTSKHKVMLQDGKTFKLKHDMVKLGDNEPKEARPVPPPTPPRAPGTSYGPGRPGRQGPRGVPADDPDMTEPPTAGPPDREGWPPRGHPGQPSRARSSREAGHLVIRVQPAGAEVLIDGERWEMPAGQERLDVAVPDGDHKIEIRKDGYQSFTTTVTVRRGENTPLNVSLPKAP